MESALSQSEFWIEGCLLFVTYRYHIIAEIMQATTINNLKGIDQFGQDDKQGKALKKDAQLRARNLKRYINQCTVAKSQCERRIKLLGGPDYTNHGGSEIKQTGQEKVKLSQKLSQPKAKVLSFTEVMENSLARSFFMLFLQNKTRSKNTLRLVQIHIFNSYFVKSHGISLDS